METLHQTQLNSFLLNASSQGDLSYHNTDNRTGTASLFTTMNRTKSDVKPKLPRHLALGVAYFPTPSQLYTVYLDYFQAQENDVPIS